ncbi:MAG: transposase [Armatimonadota bacterium]|nr:transposase [Armatimonadota bacterium]MDR7428051.1 transposase [Armatimonadota bacterium]MDR7464526.1 transposase [Armatimonadota bacterium]MDR7475811.1 transposase [Armatimonadota bacterium]MDR7538791.1 transposase [Armatimonadota bacterium]
MDATTSGTEGRALGAQARPEIAFLLLDGLRRTRPGAPTETVLCALGLSPEGTPYPLALRVAPREDERAWRAVLRDLRADGIGPELRLICCDGHPALVKAIHAFYPEIPLQISVAHRLLALSRKVDPRWRATCLAEARRIFAAPHRSAAVALFREWHARWLRQGQFAVRSLEADLASCLAFYRFPSHLWSRIRTANLVERVFREARRQALPALPAADEEEGADVAGPVAGEGPPPGEGSPLWSDRLTSASAHWDAMPGPAPSAAPAAGMELVAALLPAPPAAPPLREAPPGPPLEASLPAEPPKGEGQAHASERAEDSATAPGEPEASHLFADEGFAQWLQAEERRRMLVRVAALATSAAGLISGLLLSLAR